jgi:hypothetical protein
MLGGRNREVNYVTELAGWRWLERSAAIRKTTARSSQRACDGWSERSARRFGEPSVAPKSCACSFDFHFGYDPILRFAPVAFPVVVCSICSEEFELKPDKPGYANRCPACSEDSAGNSGASKVGQEADRELADARKKAMRDLLYRKDS